MKIYHKTELNKGYIPSDKLHYKGIPFESFGLKNFGIDHNPIVEEYNQIKYKKEERELFILSLKCRLMNSRKFKEITKEGYHTHLYLNFNVDGVDMFISR